MENSPPLNRRDFSKQILAGIGGAVLSPALASMARAVTAKAETPSQPNIVFILSDQHSYKYCGFMGHPIVRTPNLDRIAARGVVFRNTYCGNPVCCPSRSGMIAGAYGSDVNSFCNSTAWDGSLPAWPAMLRDAGYNTFGTGKMDANERFDIGFTHAVDVGNQHASKPDVSAFFRRPVCGRAGERAQIDGRSRPDRHKDSRLAVSSIDFIKKQPKDGKPWSVYCGPHMPHPSFVGMKKYYDSYLSQVDLPNVPEGHLDDLHFVFQQLRHFKNIATPIPAERQRRARAAYFAMITELDEYIGQIWDALEESGQLERTVFVYSSDHGEALGEHGLWLKNNLYDVAARVPLVVAGAGIPAGVTVDTPVAHVDLIRTFLEWGGAKTHAKLRGHSLVSLMHGKPGDHPGFAYSESHSEGNCTGSFLIRKGDWKYIHVTWHDGLLFNLAEDPGEYHNRFADPEVQPILKELQAILHAQVDPIEVTERAFAMQKKRMDKLAEGLTPDGMLDELRNRLGEGQSVEILNAYYGHTFPYTHKAAKEVVD